jgi:glutathione synthase/RimK-type ligase-like ATP-grasp enzyme
LRPSVALATCAEIPYGDEDADLLGAALAGVGLEARWEVWTDETVDWSAFDLVVLRSTWDYAEHYESFLAWLDRLPHALNPAPVARWSTDKHYLLELAAAGVPVVPSSFLAPDDVFEAPAGHFVVKPAVSAGGRRSAAYEAEDAASAAAHVARLHAEGRDVIVQPYLEGLAEWGETGVVHLRGTYSHSFRKGPLLEPGSSPGTALFLDEKIHASEPSPAEREVAERALAAIPFPATELLYARVDIAPGPGGAPLVLEVELAEPSLYLGYGEGAAGRLAAAIAAALSQRRLISAEKGPTNSQ